MGASCSIRHNVQTMVPPMKRKTSQSATTTVSHQQLMTFFPEGGGGEHELQTLQVLLQSSPTAAATFRKYLVAEHNEENLRFWLTVHEYRQLVQRVATLQQSIVEQFIRKDAPEAVNISSLCRDRILFHPVSGAKTNDDNATDDEDNVVSFHTI